MTRLNAAGNALIYSTYLGGDTATYTYNDGTAIAVDSEGSAYVVGRTEGFSFPTTAGAFQPAFGELFVTKLNPTGTALAYSSYLGGLKTLVPVPPNPSDPIPISWATGIAVDGGGNAYVAGGTYAFDHITTPGAAFPNAPGVGPSGGIGPYSDAFITKINPSGTALGYSTYLGGTGQDSAGGIAVNPAGRAYVTGWTTSGDFPVTDSVQGAPTQNSGCVPFPCTDVFTTTLAADGSAVEYSTYLGGSGSDLGSGIAVDGAGAVYVIGRTTSDDFPNVNAFQSQNHGANVDAFVAKLIPAAASAVIGLRFDRQNVLAGGSYSATVSGSDLFTSQTFFDVRFTAPGRDADVALNWQRGLGASHAVSVGTSPGTWTITGVRPHQLETDHTAGFVPVLASITISP